jgi:hypothetical protein
MANPQKLTDKNQLADVASDDLLHVVDVSDTASSAAGTSKKLQASYLIDTHKVSLSSGDVQKLRYNNTPVSVTPAPPAGHIVIPLRSFIHCHWSAGATMETSSDNIYFGYLNSATGQPFSLYYYYLDYKTDLMNGISTTNAGSRMYSLYSTGFSQYITGFSYGSGTVMPILNCKIGVWCNSDFNGGWDADIYTTYQFLKI